MGRPRSNTQEMMVAVTSGWWKAPDGTEYTFRAGETLVAKDHPLITQGNADWFEPVKPHYARPEVEETTAAPGVRRGDEY